MSGIDEIQALGLVHSLRTGNVILDAIIAMHIPMALRLSFKNSGTILETVSSLTSRFRSKHPFERRIISEKTDMQYFFSPEDDENEILIKAILHHIARNKLIKLKRAKIHLVSDEMVKVQDNIYDSESEKPLAEALKHHRPIEKPYEKTWFNIGKYGGFEVWMKLDIEVKDISTERIPARRTTQTITLQSHGETSISTFIDEAYDSYMNNLKLLIDDGTRYHYEVEFENKNCTTSDDDKKKNNEKDEEVLKPLNRNAMKYRRTKLSDDVKTFDCLFFHKKAELVRLVEQFTNKTGKYAIKGYPTKLGILLHGEPGTGKTSIIKAIAEKTGRSLVNVPLAKISSNSELASLFFNQKYHIDGEDMPIPLTFDDVIFVLEDIDAISHIVKKRDGSIELHPQNHKKRDELNLSGILNVLDGVVDTPGRLLIMTTNHPEVLDPALLRPGRIDKRMHLTYITAEDMAAMIGHCFEREVNEEDFKRLKFAMNGNRSDCIPLKITPAEVEQMAHYDYKTMEEVITAIEDHADLLKLALNELDKGPDIIMTSEEKNLWQCSRDQFSTRSHSFLRSWLEKVRAARTRSTRSPSSRRSWLEKVRVRMNLKES